MIKLDADVVILGSGFAGSLCGLILARGGRSVAVVDRAAHPRFAIGESSTPIANYVLRDISLKYQLANLLPLTRYGTWRRSYPEVTCGLKRGFSYFSHANNNPFLPQQKHANELLVAASATDEVSDTQWLRSDVDSHFARELKHAGVPLVERFQLRDLQYDPHQPGGTWLVDGIQHEESVRITARFVIDATGEAAVLPRAMGIAVSADELATRSRAVFSHWKDVGSWTSWLDTRGAAVSDHPFPCDDAAQHHVFDGAWMWILRFSNGVASAGFAIDARRYPRRPDVSPESEWQWWLDRFPSVQEIFTTSTIVDPPGKVCSTGLLPRRAARAVGRYWALLPNTAGFIDPLHSTGIAHSMCGIERLTNLLLQHPPGTDMSELLIPYERAVFTELHLIDLLVDGCYRAFLSFPLFVAYSMLYFAAATWYEHQRVLRGPSLDRYFLCADDTGFVGLVQQYHRRITALSEKRHLSTTEICEFERDIAKSLQPYNRVGLCDPSVHNMYRYTAADES